jgi:hypothetical protein
VGSVCLDEGLLDRCGDWTRETMIKKAPCTEAHIRRLIKAARREGLHIIGIKPDGTIVVRDGEAPLAPDLDDTRAHDAKWADVEA